MFALVACVEVLVVFLAGILSNLIYKNTVDILPSTIFYTFAVLALIGCTLVGYVYWKVIQMSDLFLVQLNAIPSSSANRLDSVYSQLSLSLIRTCVIRTFSFTKDFDHQISLIFINSRFSIQRVFLSCHTNFARNLKPLSIT